MFGQVELLALVPAKSTYQINGIEMRALGEHLFLAGIVEVNL